MCTLNMTQQVTTSGITEITVASVRLFVFPVECFCKDHLITHSQCLSLAEGQTERARPASAHLRPGSCRTLTLTPALSANNTQNPRISHDL